MLIEEQPSASSMAPRQLFSSPSSILHLSDDILSSILSFLDVISLTKSELVCRQFHKVAELNTWPVIDEYYQSQLQWNNFDMKNNNVMGDSSNEVDDAKQNNQQQQRKWRAIRSFRTIQYVNKMETHSDRHFWGDRQTNVRRKNNSTGLILCRNHRCSGCNLPDKLDLRWVEKPQDYDYFVRIHGVPVKIINNEYEEYRARPCSSLIYQGFYSHTSVSFHKRRRSVPTRQLTIDLNQHHDVIERIMSNSNVDAAATYNDVKFYVSVVCINKVTRGSLRWKDDLRMKLMYTSSCRQSLSSCYQIHQQQSSDSTTTTTITTMKQIHSHNVHRFDLSPTFTFGEFVHERFHPNHVNGVGGNDAGTTTASANESAVSSTSSSSSSSSWQLRIVCGTYDENIYNFDEYHMFNYYRQIDLQQQQQQRQRLQHQQQRV